jgi:fermentation-respiration switch protein FrsA (DUF1100 family)
VTADVAIELEVLAMIEFAALGDPIWGEEVFAASADQVELALQLSEIAAEKWRALLPPCGCGCSLESVIPEVEARRRALIARSRTRDGSAGEDQRTQ